MEKTKKGARFPAVIIAVLLCAALTAGCGGAGDPSGAGGGSSKAPSGTTGSFKMPETTMDMKGETVTIASIWAETSAFGEGEDGESAAGDLWKEWRRTVEAAYDCKIDVVSLNANDTQVSMINKFLAGEKVADIIVCQVVDIERTRLAGDFLTDLNTVSTMDLKCEGMTKYGKGLMEAETWNGKTYAVNAFGGNVQTVLAVNRDLLASLNLSFDPWELMEQKKWDFDAFNTVLEKAKKDLNGDGQYTSKDQYGCFTSYGLVNSMAINDGVRKLKKNPDGTCEYILNKPSTVESVNRIKRILTTSGNLPEFRLDALYSKLFKQGQLVFMPAIAWSLGGEEYAELDFKLGLLPAPLGPNGTEYYSEGDSWMQTYCIPKLNTQPEKAGLIIQSIMEDLALKLLDLDFDNIENSRFPDHPQSVEAYRLLQSNILYELAQPETGFADAYYSVVNAATQPDINITTLLEATDSGLKAYVNDVYNKAVR